MLFKKARTYRRCQTLRRYVGGLDEATCNQLAAFLLADRRNRVVVNRQFVQAVTRAGATALVYPIVPLVGTFEVMELSSKWARVAGPGSTGGGWDTFGDSDGSSFTNNNNNNNNNG